MANVLITGSNGQLGSEFKQLSRESDHHFLFTDIDELDLTQMEPVEAYFADKEIDYCINCAAYTAVDKAESDIEQAISINATAIKNLAEVCAANRAVLIHISTDFVFDGNSNRPYVETDRARPINVYGQSKYEGEIRALKEHGKTVIIRTSWLYSSYGVNFVKSMINLGQKNNSLNVIFDQVGTPTYAKDLAGSILTMVDKISADKKGHPEYYGIFHYSNEGVASWYDFALEIFKMTGITCTVNPILTKDFPTASKRPHFSVLDKTKIKQTFTITIPHWKDSLAKCLKELGY